MIKEFSEKKTKILEKVAQKQQMCMCVCMCRVTRG